MDSADREKERLRSLSELYERTDLSDLEYRRQYEKIAAEYQESSPSSSTLPVIDALGFQELAAQADRPPSTSSSGINPLDDRFNRDRFASGTRDTFSSGSMPHVKPTIAMRRVRPRPNQLFFVPVVFLLGIGMALAIGVVRGDKVSQKNPSDTPSKAPDTTVVQAAPTVRLIKPKFGPDAVAACQTTCERWGVQEKQVCMRGCQRRSLEMYGKRITLEELNPKAEAVHIVQACLQKDNSLPRAENEFLWRNSLQPFVSALTATGQSKGAYYSRELYQQLYDAQLKALLPPDAESAQDEITSQILSAGCLLAHDSLSLWAFETVERQDDDFSAAFYAQLRDELARPKLESVTAIQRELSAFNTEFTP